MRRLRLNWKDRFGGCAPPSQLPWFKELLLWEPSKSRLAGRFFRLRTRLPSGSLDLKTIMHSEHTQEPNLLTLFIFFVLLIAACFFCFAPPRRGYDRNEIIPYKIKLSINKYRLYIYWICPYISRHLLSLNPLQARCRRYSRGER